MSGLDGALSASHASFKPMQEVVFAGWGEPTLRWETTMVVAESVRMAHKNVNVCMSGREYEKTVTVYCVFAN